MQPTFPTYEQIMCYFACFLTKVYYQVNLDRLIIANKEQIQQEAEAQQLGEQRGMRRMPFGVMEHTIITVILTLYRVKTTAVTDAIANFMVLLGYSYYKTHGLRIRQHIENQIREHNSNEDFQQFFIPNPEIVSDLSYPYPPGIRSSPVSSDAPCPIGPIAASNNTGVIVYPEFEYSEPLSEESIQSIDQNNDDTMSIDEAEEDSDSSIILPDMDFYFPYPEENMMDDLDLY